MNGNLWRGERVFLRAFSMKDVDLYVGMIADPDSEADRLGDFVGVPRAPEHRRGVLERRVTNPEDPDAFFRFMIDDADGNTVGTLTAQNIDTRCGTFETGFAIFAQYRRRGYAVDALTVALRYYFGERRLNKCTNTVYAFNAASIALHEKYGFLLEGRVRRGAFSHGRHYDALLYGMTDDEFFAAHPFGS